MNIDNNLKRTNALIKQGNILLKTNRRPFYKLSSEVENIVAQEWGTSCLHLIAISLGTDTVFYKNFQKNYERFPDSHFAEKALGVLISFKKIIESNLKAKRERVLLSSKILLDLVEQAEYLAKYEYFVPAIMILGVTMESLLRNTGEIEFIDSNKKMGFSALNDILHKQGIYDSLMFRKISFSIELRNNVAHGNFDGLGNEEFTDMLRTVKKLKVILEN